MESFDHGIHKLLLFKIVSGKLVKDDSATLAHIHNVYATWRHNKGFARQLFTALTRFVLSTFQPALSSMNRVLLFNPRSANYKPRIPNSILSIASSIEGLYDYVVVDGNLENDPWDKIHRYLAEGGFKIFRGLLLCRARN